MMNLKAVYEPQGKAREYAPLALNIYKTCPHACAYCYAPGALHTTRANYFAAPQLTSKFLIPSLVSDAVKIRDELNRTPVLLSFASDPFPVSYAHEPAISAISILTHHNVPVIVLTKNPMAALHSVIDNKIPTSLVTIATTITGMSQGYVKRWEPGAPEPLERVAALLQAKRFGFATFLSMEPVIDADEAENALLCAADYADRVSIGRWNHRPAGAVEPDYKKFLRRAAQIYPGVLGIKHDLIEAITR